MPTNVTQISGYVAVDDQYFVDTETYKIFYDENVSHVESWFFTDGVNSLSSADAIPSYLNLEIMLNPDGSVLYGDFSAGKGYSFANPLLSGDLVNLSNGPWGDTTQYCQRDYYVEPSGWCSIAGTYVSDSPGTWTATVAPACGLYVSRRD